MTLIRTTAAALLVAATITSVRAASPFDEYSRKQLHPADVYGYFHSMNGTTDFSGGRLKDKGFVGGVGLGFNLSDYFNLNTEIGGGSVDTTLEGAIGKIDTKVFEWKLGLDYNILKRRLTPMVSAEIGMMNQSGGGDDGFSEATFTYGVGAGVRYDITDRIMAKVAYRLDWTNFKDSTSSTMYRGVFGSLGYKF
jgi:opacity protein-like surface antigen